MNNPLMVTQETRLPEKHSILVVQLNNHLMATAEVKRITVCLKVILKPLSMAMNLNPNRSLLKLLLLKVEISMGGGGTDEKQAVCYPESQLVSTSSNKAILCCRRREPGS